MSTKEERDPLLCEIATIMGSKPASELVQNILAKFNFEQPKHNGDFGVALLTDEQRQQKIVGIQQEEI